MHKVSLALAFVGASASLLAQNCNTSPPAGVLRNYDPPSASFYYPCANDQNSNSFLFNMNLQTPIRISMIETTTYAQGAGNPVVPTQIGNVAWAKIYVIPGTRIGNEGSPTNWVHVADAELTIVAWNSWSPIANFKDPVTGLPLPNNELLLDPADPTMFDAAGNAGIAVEVIATTYYQTPVVGAPNVGDVPWIGYVDPNPTPSAGNQFFTIDEFNIRQNGWWTVDPNTTPANDIVLNATPGNPAPTGRPNIAIHFTPDPQAAVVVPFGDGCYDRPQAVWEQIPEATFSGTGTVDIEGTGWTLLPQNSPITNYILIPGPGYVAPSAAAPNLANGTFTSSSSASWDDASVTQNLNGMSFPFVGSTTTDITINSNARVYLGVTTDGSFETNGANYGSPQVLQNGPPSGPLAQIYPFNTDLDPTVGGTIVYEEFGGTPPTSVRVTWHNVPNWPATTPGLVQTSLTLHSTGQIDIAYGTLVNGLTGSGNDAIVGLSKGDGSPLGAMIDWSTSIGLTTGDGAFPPSLFLDGRPIANTSVDVVIGDLSPGTTAGFVVIGNNFQAAPGLNLVGFGLPDCFSHLDLAAVVASIIVFPNPQNEMRWTWSVPPGFNGTQVFLQGATLTPGYNVAGALVTNAGCAKIGT